MSFHLLFSFFLLFISCHSIYANTFVTVNNAGEDVRDVVYTLALYSPPLLTTESYVTIPINSTTACNITNFLTDDGNVWYQSNGETYAGTVLLVEEKDCDIMQQASVAQRIGVRGLVIISPSSSHVITTPIPPSFTLTIPLLSISKIDGIRIITFLNSSNMNHMEIAWEASQPITTMIPTGTISSGTTEIPTTDIPTTQLPTIQTPTTQIPTTQTPTTTLAPISSTGSTSSSTGMSRSSTAIPVNDASTCIPSIFILLMTFFCHVY